MLNGWVAAFHHASDDGMALAGTLEVGHHLAHGSAGIELAQPGGDVGIGIVGSLLLLDVHQHHGHVEVAHGGQHVVGGAIGEQLQDDEVDVGGAELVASGHRHFLGGHHASVDDLDGVGEGFLERLVLRLEFGNELWELRQVCL